MLKRKSLFEVKALEQNFDGKNVIKGSLRKSSGYIFYENWCIGLRVYLKVKEEVHCGVEDHRLERIIRFLADLAAEVEIKILFFNRQLDILENEEFLIAHFASKNILFLIVFCRN